MNAHNTSHRFIVGGDEVTAKAVQSDDGNASLVVDFSGKTPTPDERANYQILDTDYDTYAIVYDCRDYGFFSFDYLWILAREPEISDQLTLELIGKIEEMLPNYGYFKNMQYERQGRTCPYSKRPLGPQ